MGRRAIDMTGTQIGHLTVLGREPNNTRNSAAVWLVRCDCGVVKPMRVNTLRNQIGPNKSCGCRGGNFRHGLRRTALYVVWDCMVARCEREHNASWRWYGGRGRTRELPLCDFQRKQP
jgi:hypothetical protein